MALVLFWVLFQCLGPIRSDTTTDGVVRWVTNLAGGCGRFGSVMRFGGGVLGAEPNPSCFLCLDGDCFYLQDMLNTLIQRRAKACVIIRSPLYERASPLRARG